MKSKGKFIVIEGVDGAGTTTQTGLLVKHLRKNKLRVLQTAEPTGGFIGKIIRNILKGKTDVAHETLALLFAADRVEHWNDEIKPALDKDVWVVSDRYTLSSVVYQSLNCDEDWVRALNSRVGIPDITILLDLPVNKAIKRVSVRNEKREIFEKKKTLDRVSKLYLDASKKRFCGKVALLDAARSIPDVQEEIISVLKREFGI